MIRVFACIDAPGNDLTTTREVPISVHLRGPVPAGGGSAAKVLPLLLVFGFAFDSANYYLPIANGCYPCSATKMPSATVPLPVNFLAVRQLSGRADIGTLFQPRNVPGEMFRCILCTAIG